VHGFDRVPSLTRFAGALGINLKLLRGRARDKRKTYRDPSSARATGVVRDKLKPSAKNGAHCSRLGGAVKKLMTIRETTETAKAGKMASRSSQPAGMKVFL
jgi:hypothetical protein